MDQFTVLGETVIERGDQTHIYGKEIPQNNIIRRIQCGLHLWGGNCANNSRVCRYCHPEVSMCIDEIILSVEYIPSYISEENRKKIDAINTTGFERHT